MKYTKYIIIILTLLIAVATANAVMIDKPLLNISNCYNLTLTADLERGNETPISFTGCTRITNNKWHCDCFKADHTDFLLVMQTDNAILRDERRYRINIDARVYDYELDHANFKIDDWGDYVDTGSIDLINLGSNKEIIKVPQLIYINKTIYQDKIINNTVYQDVIKNVYIENTTKIEALNNNVTNLNKDLTKYQSTNRWLKITVWILAIIIILIILYEMFG